MSLVRLLLFMCLGVVAAVPLHAQSGQVAPQSVQVQPGVSHLTDVLLIDEIFGIMRLEGIEYGTQLEEELFPRKGGAGWAQMVDLIYDPGAMRRRFDETFRAELSGEPGAVRDILGFFETKTGAYILELEVEARRSLMDEAVEDAAKARVEDMQAGSDRRLQTIERFAEVNDLIDSNVSGALNANLAFFQGLGEAGGLGDEMTESQMLTEVWAQEPDIRAETEDWLYPYLALAYGPLPDEDLDSYIAFSETPAGQKLNHALFAAFDAVFTAISRDLGRAAARQMTGEDI